MNEQRIEEILLEMPLAEPSAELDDRVLGLDEADRQRFRLVTWTSGAVGLAAGLAVALAIWGVLQLDDATRPIGDGGPSGEVAKVDRLAPGGATEAAETMVETSDTKLVDEGLVLSDDRIPVHQIRRVTTHQLMYYNKATNERLEVTEPREQVILIASEPF